MPEGNARIKGQDAERKNRDQTQRASQPFLLKMINNDNNGKHRRKDTYINYFWWLVRVNSVVALGFFPKFWEVAGTYKWLFCSKNRGWKHSNLRCFFSKLMHFQVVGTLKLWALLLAPTVSNMSHLVKLSLPNIFCVLFLQGINACIKHCENEATSVMAIILLHQMTSRPCIWQR